MKLDNLNNLYEQIEQTAKIQRVSNFNLTNANHPKIPILKKCIKPMIYIDRGIKKGFQRLAG
ncbi:hypothetical protein J3U56_12110, partial [Gilliamella sp. B2824]|uniref:hypothetical protein n=1 Tax=Gilliamella sp. B2824 TaxID=2818019 RepID=UPI002269E5CC